MKTVQGPEVPAGSGIVRLSGTYYVVIAGEARPIGYPSHAEASAELARIDREMGVDRRATEAQQSELRG